MKKLQNLIQNSAFSNQETKLEIDFNKNEFNSFNESNSSFEYPANKFQINLRYKLN